MAESFNKKIQNIRLNLLLGITQENIPISKLRNVLKDLLPIIEKPLYHEFYQQCINKNDTPYMIWPRPFLGAPNIMSRNIEFPAPRDININMMPVRLGGGIFNSLPESFRDYANFIFWHCPTTSYYYNDISGELKNRIGYLTIQEGFVPEGEAQRRPGLHIERPGAIKCKGTWHKPNSDEYRNISWGCGHINENGLPEDGIFMASTVDNSCAIYNALIDNPEELADKHGGIEKIRNLLGAPRLLKANEMCWFTDRTPHESLPIDSSKKVYRQFFRLVVGPISVWYSKHNTPNPLGVQPDAIISDEDKFSP